MVLFALCLGYFMVILDATIVNVALPELQQTFGGDVAGLQWVVDGYTLPFAALLLTAGAVADWLGNRRLLIAGLGVFAGSSAAAALATTLATLVGFRMIQGVGAAMMVPASLALIRASFDDRGARARAIGVWGSVAGIGAASGPVLGGLLVAVAGWRAVFAVNLPIGIAAIALTGAHVRETSGNGRERLTLIAPLAVFVALGGITLATIEAGRDGLGGPLVLGGLVAFAVAAGVFVLAERRATEPMVPRRILGRRLSGASAIGALINLGFYGQLFVFNLYLQGIRGYSALTAGLALLPEAGLVSVASFVSGRLTAVRGPRPTAILGTTLATCGLLGLAAIGADTPYLLLVPAMLATGAGMALTMPAATTSAIEATEVSEAGLASGLINAARQVGGVIGIALLGSLAAGGDIAGTRTAMVAGAVAFGLAVVLAVATLGPRGSRAQSGLAWLSSGRRRPARYP
jgi:DHA2 family methylenomycin A resistance protein-like MFS transporter